MLLFKRESDGSIVENQTGNTVSLVDIREHIGEGESVRVINGLNEEVTQSVLLEIVSIDLHLDSTKHRLNRELEEFIRESVRFSDYDNVPSFESKFDVDTLHIWRKSLLNFNERWYRAFRRTYYTWDYPCLMGSIMLNHWMGQPIEIETALSYMERGSRSTKSERLKNLISEGWVTKVQQKRDRRRMLIVPTTELESIAQSLMEQSFVDIIELLSEVMDLESHVLDILEKVRIGNNRQTNNTMWLGFVESVLFIGKNWSQCVTGEFLRVEYWSLFLGLVQTNRNNEIATIQKISQYLRTSSARTRNSLLQRSIDLKLIKTSKLKSDRRVTIYMPTSKLEHIVQIHCIGTLEQFLSFIESITEEEDRHTI